MDYKKTEIEKIIDSNFQEFKRKISIIEFYYSNESHTTKTNLSKDSFTAYMVKEGDIYPFNNGKNITVLFNDLKNSTKLIQDLLTKDKIEYYSNYMFYSSKMLSEILELFDGKMVESTGDGNYSIFESLRKDRINDEYFEYKIRHFYKLEFQEYIKNFDEKEINFINYKADTDDKKLRQLIFYIFFLFNEKVNKLLYGDIKYKFLTRVGCATGECYITRIENEHIKQDKLIGEVVHRASHQASGKS
jgi:hypothetical protein